MKSLYIHIPFCESKCHYCDFCSFKCDEFTQSLYMQKLTEEMQNLDSSEPLETIFIGGGTPSILSLNLIKPFLQNLSKKFVFSENFEFTIECNPNSLTLEKMQAYKDLGINRISLGVQTLNDSLLKSIGRIHTASDFFEIAEQVQKHFENYNFDLMIGLPNQTLNDIEQSLNSVVKFQPTHISLYSLILEPNTKLQVMVEQGKTNLPNPDQVASDYDFAKKILESAGLKRYEISNFAKPNYECRHNQNYWECGEYYGIGLSAHSHQDGVRAYNTSNLKDYLTNQAPTIYQEKLTLEEKITEQIMLGLRTKKGIDLNYLKQNLNYDILYEKKHNIAQLQSQKMLELVDNHLKLAEESFYICDAITLQLI